MAKQKFSVLFLSCAICALASASIKYELNFLSNDVPISHSQRQISNNSDQLITVYKNIVDQLANSVNGCKDSYSIVCSGDLEIENEIISLKTIRKSILNILKTPFNKKELELLKIEKNLFYNCMNLGEEKFYIKEQMLGDFEYIISRIYDHVTSYSSWQSLDALLSSLGFGHAFYEIKVEHDPEIFAHHIVTLQPPSYIHVKRTHDLVRKILNSSNIYVSNEGWNIWKFFETMKRSKDEIELFFDSLLQIISTPAGEHKRVQHKDVQKTTLKSWQKSSNSYSSNVAQINWIREISQEFERANVTIDTNYEDLLIKNEQYFLNLYELLNSTSHNLISSVILMKMLAEQLPYVDWKNFHALKSVVKEDFCFEETKLYGASFVELQRLMEKNINGISSKTVLNTLNNIVSVMNADISESYSLPSKHKKYLKNKLNWITTNILQLQDAKSVAGYYEDYQPVRNYFTDILNYRKMIRNKELSTLRYGSQLFMHEMQLYSIVDLSKPRNRFLTKLLTSNMKIEVPMHRALFYSKFAADVAQFLYSLLNENNFADYKYDFEGTESQLDTYPIFSTFVIDCYRQSMKQEQNQNKKFIKHMLTTMFGLHIAYEAMLNDYAVIGVTPREIQISQNNSISHDKMFFVSYLKNHCSLGSNLLNEIFSKFDLIRASMCNDRSDQAARCEQLPFDVQSRYIFLT